MINGEGGGSYPGAPDENRIEDDQDSAPNIFREFDSIREDEGKYYIGTTKKAGSFGVAGFFKGTIGPGKLNSAEIAIYPLESDGKTLTSESRFDPEMIRIDTDNLGLVPEDILSSLQEAVDTVCILLDDNRSIKEIEQRLVGES